jgi:hypothetical protein
MSSTDESKEAPPLDVPAIEERLEQLLENGAESERGAPVPEDAIREVEARLGTSFPADYRTFLQTFGSLHVSGMGEFKVFALDELEQLRADWRAEFDRWAAAGWRDVPPAAEPSPDVVEKRGKLQRRLGLREEHLRNVVGDAFDELRVAYETMVPILADHDSFHHVAVCVGPSRRIYAVSIKGYEIETPSPSQTFASKLDAFIDAELKA